MQARPNIWPGNKSLKDMPVMPHKLMNTVKTLLSQISKLCINFTISSNEVYNSMLQYKSCDIMNLVRDTKHFLHQSRCTLVVVIWMSCRPWKNMTILQPSNL